MFIVGGGGGGGGDTFYIVVVTLFVVIFIVVVLPFLFSTAPVGGNDSHNHSVPEKLTQAGGRNRPKNRSNPKDLQDSLLCLSRAQGPKWPNTG